MGAGDDLRAALDRALQREAKARGRDEMRFDEVEQIHVDSAVMAADAIELLTSRIDAAGSDMGAGDLVKLISERRQQQARLSEAARWLSARLPAALGAFTDPQRQGAVVARHQRRGRQ